MDANVLRSYCDVRTTRYTYSCVNCIWYAWYVVCTTVSVGVSFIYEGFVPWFQSLWNFDWKFDENLWNFDWNFDECLWNWTYDTNELALEIRPKWILWLLCGCVWIRIETIRCWEQICFVNFIVKRLNCTEYEILQRSIVLDSTRYKNQQNMHPRATKMKKLMLHNAGLGLWR